MMLARDPFDIPADVAYLNCAYMGALPIGAVEAGARALAAKARPWHIGAGDFFEPVTELRPKLAAVLGGDAAGVALTSSVSYGVAVAANNLPVRSGQQIVVLAEQFPSNVYAWRVLARRNDAEVVVVDRPPDLDWTAAIDRAVTGRTAIVAVPACHWTDGTRVDLEAVGERARGVEAALVVDVCQAAGAVPIDVRRIDPDFVVGAVYKWLLGPYSLGYLWAAPRHRDGEPIEFNWITRAGSEDFAALVNYGDEYGPGARRFDTGEVSNFVGVAVANAALDYLAEHPPAVVAEHGRTLTTRILDGAADLGFAVAPAPVRSPHLVGVGLPARLEPGAVAGHLAERNIHVSVRGSSVRISVHLWNTTDDADRLLAALAEL
jgi:selenocysteine lyase/cysteine desulfurase